MNAGNNNFIRKRGMVKIPHVEKMKEIKAYGKVAPERRQKREKCECGGDCSHIRLPARKYGRTCNRAPHLEYNTNFSDMGEGGLVIVLTFLTSGRWQPLFTKLNLNLLCEQS